MKRALFLSLMLLTASALGHEGHQPLPTKGVQVDLKTGRITLSKPARSVIDVQTTEVTHGESRQSLRAYATLVPPWTKYAIVTSRLSGRITAIHVRPGDHVEAGGVVAEVESLELHTLRLSYQQAISDVELSRKILEGVAPAARAGSISEQRLIEAQQVHRQNDNTLQVLRAKAEGLNVDVSMLSTDDESRPLRLPIRTATNGVVVHSDLAVGKFIEPTEHLMDLVDLSTVWVRIGVLEQDVHRVAVGQHVRLTINGLPGHVFEAKVDRLGQILDPQTHQSLAWAELTNSVGRPTLRPGMNGQVELSLGGERALLSVPSEAILSDGAERYVLVEQAATKTGSEYQKVPIVVGRKAGGMTNIVAANLLPGDRVVTRGGHELSSLFFLGVLRIGTETARNIGLKVEPVAEHAVDRVLSLEGAIDVPPQRRTTASSQLSGKLVKLSVTHGQRVKAGQALAEIASLEFQDLQLELLREHLDGELWRGTLERLKSSGEAVPRRMVLETEGRVSTTTTRGANLRQKLRLFGLTATQIDTMLTTQQVLATFPVSAPIDGDVVDFDGRLGQVVRADETLFEIHDLSQVRVQVFVPERDSSHVQVGQSARIRLVAFPELPLQGTVSRLGPVVGVDTRTHTAWIELHDMPPITAQHNMAARITLTVDQTSPTLAVPTSAVVRDGLRSSVFVQKADGTFDRRRVELGRSDDRFTEILRGLNRGEQIATRGVPQIQTAFAAVR